MTLRDAEHNRAVSSRTIPIPMLGLPQIRVAAVLAIGLATFLVGWLVLGADDKPAQPAAQPNTVSAISEAELREFAASSPNPVYWAGPRAAQTYELFKTQDGRVYVRYLPAGVKVGDPRPQFLTVGTYPRANAFAELKRAARAEGAVSRELPQGGLAVFVSGKSNIYFGYPDAGYQVEVYAPSPGSARELVLSGQVVPVR
jgi:hypothetical protein